MSHSLVARIGVNLIGQCLSCLLGGAAGSKDTSSLNVIATRSALRFYMIDATYGSCFQLTNDIFEQYDFGPPLADNTVSDDAEINISIDRADLTRCADYATKIGAQQIKLECSNSRFVIFSTAANGHSHEQGFTLLSDDQRLRRRLMPIQEQSGTSIGVVQTVYATQLKSYLELFKSAIEVRIKFQSEERDKMGMMLSAEDRKYIARFPLRENNSDTKQFFCLYHVSRPIEYRLNTTSINRLHQVLKSSYKYLRSVRVELYLDALLWEFDVGGGETNQIMNPVFVRHDIPQMSGLR